MSNQIGLPAGSPSACALATASSAAARPCAGGRRERRRELREPALPRARRLQADVQRQQAPPERSRVEHPLRREVRLRARAVRAADVDAERTVRRRRPRLQRRRRRRLARIERVAGEHTGAHRTACCVHARRDEQHERERDETQPSHPAKGADLLFETSKGCPARSAVCPLRPQCCSARCRRAATAPAGAGRVRRSTSCPRTRRRSPHRRAGARRRRPARRRR